MKDYNDVKLVKNDYQVLNTIEKRLKEHERYYEDLYPNFATLDYRDLNEEPPDMEGGANAFFAENGRVIHLSISTYKIEEFPYEILALDELELLYLTIHTETIPKELLSLPKLKFLYLGEISFEEPFPEDIEENTVLNVFVISIPANLKIFPEVITKLTSLERFYLDKSQIERVSESIGDLKKITLIDLRDNQITELPDSIGSIKSLKTLVLPGNKLESLPETIGDLQLLKSLSLSDNKLTTLPDSIGKLSSLEKLFLYNNKLTSLPDSIGKLSSLKVLDLRNNKLTSLPDSIGKLSSLEMLDLRDNPSLSSLPKSLTHLTSLRSINLWGTNISKDDKIVNLLTDKGVRISI